MLHRPAPIALSPPTTTAPSKAPTIQATSGPATSTGPMPATAKNAAPNSKAPAVAPEAASRQSFVPPHDFLELIAGAGRPTGDRLAFKIAPDVGAQICRLIHRPHAAFTKQTNDAIPADRGGKGMRGRTDFTVASRRTWREPSPQPQGQAFQEKSHCLPRGREAIAPAVPTIRLPRTPVLRNGALALSSSSRAA
jgi:hypothetical protein